MVLQTLIGIRKRDFFPQSDGKERTICDKWCADYWLDSAVAFPRWQLDVSCERIALFRIKDWTCCSIELRTIGTYLKYFRAFFYVLKKKICFFNWRFKKKIWLPSQSISILVNSGELRMTRLASWLEITPTSRRCSSFCFI